MITSLIALPYEIARLPLVVVDQRLSRRLPDDSGVRVTLDRAIGTSDRFAGALLGNRDLTKRGVERLERSEKLRMAVQLEEEAATRRQQARETAGAGREEAARTRRAAQERAEKGLEEADAAEARGKKQAAAKARKTATAKKTAADKRAASRTTQAEQGRKRAEGAAETKRKSAARKATSELDEARATKKAAAQSREDAERLSDLTETKKQERTED